MGGSEAALEIRVLHRHGTSIREIAREVGVSRNTVRHICRESGSLPLLARNLSHRPARTEPRIGRLRRDQARNALLREALASVL